MTYPINLYVYNGDRALYVENVDMQKTGRKEDGNFQNIMLKTTNEENTLDREINKSRRFKLS